MADQMETTKQSDFTPGGATYKETVDEIKNNFVSIEQVSETGEADSIVKTDGTGKVIAGTGGFSCASDTFQEPTQIKTTSTEALSVKDATDNEVFGVDTINKTVEAKKIYSYSEILGSFTANETKTSSIKIPSGNCAIVSFTASGIYHTAGSFIATYRDLADKSITKLGSSGYETDVNMTINDDGTLNITVSSNAVEGSSVRILVL